MSGYADDARNPERTMGGEDATTGAADYPVTAGAADAEGGTAEFPVTTRPADATMGSQDATTGDEYAATTDHDVIRRWAEDRHATPATVGGQEGDGVVGELRLDFDFGNDLEDLRAVTWDEWFAAFDDRGAEFVYQDATRADGSRSNDFHLEERRAG